MRLFIVQDDSQDSGAVLFLCKALQQLPSRDITKVYLVTDSKHMWELGFTMKIDGYIKKAGFLERLKDILDL